MLQFRRWLPSADVKTLPIQSIALPVACLEPHTSTRMAYPSLSRPGRIHVDSSAGSLVLTCRNVSIVDVALTGALLASAIATVCTIVACIHIFLRFAIFDGSPVIVLHLGWTIGGTFMILLGIQSILKLVPHVLYLFKTVLAGSGDVLRVEAAGWNLLCHMPEKGRVGLGGIWWPPTKDAHSGATSSLRGALVRAPCSCLTSCGFDAG